MSAQALSNISVLERYIEKNKNDKIIAGTINKIIHFKIDKYKKQLNDLEKELRLFETKYEMASPQFFNDF